SGTLGFNDEYMSRVPTLATALDDAVHSVPAPPPFASSLLDDADFPVLFDFDADGDQDLVLQIADNVPRFFENLGADVDGDGLITAADGSGLGTFEDVTNELARWIRPTTDANDMTAVDLDA